MLFLAILVLALVATVGFTVLGLGASDLDEVGMFLAACAGLVALAMVIVLFAVNGSAYTAALADRNDAIRLQRTETIYAQRSDDLTRQIRDVLVQQYPQYERSVIQTVVDGDPRLILLRFPDLRASQTLIQYTQDLTNLRSAVYDQRIQRQGILARMRSRKQNAMLYITGLIPGPPSR